MNAPKQPTDFSTRRRSLGASRETMAAGLGLPVDAVRAIEYGEAGREQCTDYDAWLGRIEAWPADRRMAQLLAAGKGGRFAPDGE
jgi:hypothetical protein